MCTSSCGVRVRQSKKVFDLRHNFSLISFYLLTLNAQHSLVVYRFYHRVMEFIFSLAATDREYPRKEIR